MKFCIKCGKEIDDGEILCPDCKENQTLETAEQEPETKDENSNDLQSETETNVPLSPITSDENAPEVTEEEPKEINNDFQPVMMPLAPKKKKKGLLISLIVVVLLISGVVIAGFLTDWFGIISPFDKLVLAFKNTLEADSLTVKWEVSAGKSSGEVDARIIIDREKEEFTAFIEANNTSRLYYDEKLYYYDEDSDYADTLNFDTDEIFDSYNDVYSEEGVDWDELIDKLSLKKFIDADKMDAFIEALRTNYLNNSEWMTKALDFKRESNVYSISPDLEMIYDDILDLAKDMDVLKKDGKNAISEAQKNIDKIIEQLEIEVSITLDGNYISKIEAEMSFDNSIIEFVIEISDINDTEITEEEIEDFIDEVKEAIENDKCPDCGERMYGTETCYNCPMYCYDCYDRFPKDEMNYYDGSYYCDDCVEECDWCGDAVPEDDLYYYGGYEYCYDCYSLTH